MNTMIIKTHNEHNDDKLYMHNKLVHDDNDKNTYIMNTYMIMMEKYESITNKCLTMMKKMHAKQTR